MAQFFTRPSFLRQNIVRKRKKLGKPDGFGASLRNCRKEPLAETVWNRSLTLSKRLTQSFTLSSLKNCHTTESLICRLVGFRHFSKIESSGSNPPCAPLLKHTYKLVFHRARFLDLFSLFNPSNF
eukprot:Pompholyxophrys_punicea_v1_NODE_299_length_2331_cov_12.599297.p1 type:complete len:125 gc:universal NODE_299_length_2331_cov_12.599297:1906-1532(-)